MTVAECHLPVQPPQQPFRQRSTAAKGGHFLGEVNLLPAAAIVAGGRGPRLSTLNAPKPLLFRRIGQGTTPYKYSVVCVVGMVPPR
jgi:hypothetical protein